jgi:3-dehydroquinate synthase/2-deoxy-scyllo-inosose synthase
VDEREAAAGMIFAYGHTVGHALDLCYPTGVLPHRLAIYWGMRCCSYIASQLRLMDGRETAHHDALIRRLLREGLPKPLPTRSDVMSRVMRDSKRGRAHESPDECACVLLAEIGKAIQSDTMLSKCLSTLVADWLHAQGLRA